MPLILDLTPVERRRLQAEASRRGTSMTDLARSLIARGLSGGGAARQGRSPEAAEWIEAFEAWVAQQDATRPVVADGALRRDTIYDDRI